MTTKRWEPPFHAAAPRVGEPGREYSHTDARGDTRTIRADANGIVWPLEPNDVALADLHGLATASDWTFPAAAADEGAQVEPGIGDLTVAQLRDRADALGLDMPPRAKKADLVEAIAEAEASAVEPTEGDTTEPTDEPEDDSEQED